MRCDNNGRQGIDMHYAEVTGQKDGGYVAACYCGWSESHSDFSSADRAAEAHQRTAEASE